jgi:cytochrome P450
MGLSLLTVEGRIAPGPPGYPLVGNMLEFRHDVLKLGVDAARTYGDVVRFKLGPHVIHLINHPDHVEHVLVHNQANYDRATRSAAQIALVCGQSLLTTSGAIWRSERRLVQPALQHRSVQAFVSVMTSATAAMLDRWSSHARDSRPLDVASELSRLTYTIVGKALFGADVSRDADLVEHALATLLDLTYARLERLINLPLWVPSPGNRRFHEARLAIDRVVYRIINERRERPEDHADLLAHLLRAVDDGGSGGMTSTQLRNETLTLLLSGHETTASALSWTLFLLATHPEIERRFRSEVAAVIGDAREPSLEDVSHLEYTGMVLNEALRLYPPIWVLERRAIAGDIIGGYHIPAGSTVVVSPFILHRHEAFWPDPSSFDPERFAAPQTAGRPPHAYLPFGAGPHQCIGAHFATLEARIILVMLAQRYRLELMPHPPVEPKAGITLRLRHGLHMRPREERGA